MLNAQANQAIHQQIAKIEREIKETESSIDPSKEHIGKKVVRGATVGALGTVGMFLGYGIATALSGGGFLAVAGIVGGCAGLAGGGLLGYSNRDILLARKLRNGITKINTMSGELLSNKLKLLENASPGSVIDFVFNREPTIEIEEQELLQTEQPTKAKQAKNTKKVVSDKSIDPIILDADLKSKLMTALRTQDKKPLKIRIRKIDISRTKLKFEDLQDLLTAGLGNFDTEHLILRCNGHTTKAIQILKNYIVDKKSAFQNLKTLDLSGNSLNGTCLDEIAQIAKHLQLQNLILSDNVELGGKLERDHFVEGSEKPLQDFFKIKPRLSSLKNIGLKNTGLQEVQAEQVSVFLEKSLQLQELDVNENEKLSYTAFVDFINKGVAENISLEKLTTVHDEYLEADSILEARDAAFKDCKAHKTQQTAWALHLINYVLTNSKLPTNATEYLSTKKFNEDKIKKIVGVITKAREDHLGIKKGTKTPISEREFFSYFAKDLPELYKLVRDKKIKNGIDEELIKNINLSQVKNKKASLVAKVNPAATPRTKVNPAASSSKLRRATPKKKESPVAPKTKASPSRQSPRFVSSHKNDSVSQVNESVGKRSKVKSFDVQSKQPEALLPLYQAARNAGLRAQVEQSIGKAPTQSSKVGDANRFRI